jgi:hypothetical protein
MDQDKEQLQEDRKQLELFKEHLELLEGRLKIVGEQMKLERNQMDQDKMMISAKLEKQGVIETRLGAGRYIWILLDRKLDHC